MSAYILKSKIDLILLDSVMFEDYLEQSFEELRFDINQRPPSSRRSNDYSKKIKELIKEKTKDKTFLFIGEVKIDIEWFVHPQLRFETASTPDVDNIIKPIIDGLCGPDSILVDDCQVQSVSCSWIDTTDYDQSFSCTVEPHFIDDRFNKAGLKFVNIKSDLCFPINENEENEFIEDTLKVCLRGINYKEKISKEINDYFFASMKMPLLKFFHKERLGRFEVENMSDFCQRKKIDCPL